MFDLIFSKKKRCLSLFRGKSFGFKAYIWIQIRNFPLWETENLKEKNSHPIQPGISSSLAVNSTWQNAQNKSVKSTNQGSSWTAKVNLVRNKNGEKTCLLIQSKGWPESKAHTWTERDAGRSRPARRRKASSERPRRPAIGRCGTSSSQGSLACSPNP